MFFVMAIAGMVCTALSVSGQAITDLKTGYWLGSTPSAQEKVKFLGVIAAAIAVGLTIVMLARTFQFGEALPGDLRPVLASPQASIMKALVEGFMSHQPMAYLLFGVGAMIALIMEMLGQPSLIFALGMYLPLELNTPALVGGFLSHWLNKRSEKTGGERGRTIRERGVIIASGLMAGGALGGVFGAALRLIPGYREDLIKTPFYSNEPVSQSVSALLFVGLCLYVWFGSVRKISLQRMNKGDSMDQVGRFVADAVLGIDTLWGGDVMCPSGTGRFIADSWFSDEPLPLAYTDPAAAVLRESGGVTGKNLNRAAVEDYLRRSRHPQRDRGYSRRGAEDRPDCAANTCLACPLCLETMWDLAMEVLGKGDPVPYERCVEASTGRPPEPSKPEGEARARCRTARPCRLLHLRCRRPCWVPSTLGARSGWFRWRRCALWARQSSPSLIVSPRQICCPIFPRNCARCLERTSNSCRSKTPGSPAP